MTQVTNVEQYIPTHNDICGRCGTGNYPVVARRSYDSRWVINVCEHCLETEEINTVSRRVYEL